VPSLHQLRQHLQDCEREREWLANRVRLQRTRPLPALLGDELDPDEQAMITAACEDDLGRAEAAIAIAARELDLAAAGTALSATQRLRGELEMVPVLEFGGPEVGIGGPHPMDKRPFLRSSIAFLGACLTLIVVMQVLAGVEPSTGALAAIGSGCLLYAVIMRLCPRAHAEFIFAGTCLVLLAGLHALAGMSPSVGGLAVAAAASLLYGLAGRARA
jgi:hypothetical protein